MTNDITLDERQRNYDKAEKQLKDMEFHHHVLTITIEKLKGNLATEREALERLWREFQSALYLAKVVEEQDAEIQALLAKEAE